MAIATSLGVTEGSVRYHARRREQGQTSGRVGRQQHRLEGLSAEVLPGTRRLMFEQLDRPAMQPLLAERFVYSEWKKARVHIDHHVEVDGHYYTVPYQLVGHTVDVRFSAQAAREGESPQGPL